MHKNAKRQHILQEVAQLTAGPIAVVSASASVVWLAAARVPLLCVVPCLTFPKLLLLLLTIAPSCFRLAPAGLLPPAAPAGLALGGSLALPVTTSNRVGSELICLNSFDLQQ
jgi:hypothetical protein